MRYGHLERLNIKLRALSPAFIGSGEHFNKKEYILDSKNEVIYIPNFPQLITFLKQRSLLPKYEEFLTNLRANDFRAFLAENKVTAADYASFTSYTINAGEAVHNINFREVLTFIKDSDGFPYIPGSSIKGAIRTAIAAQIIKKGDWTREWKSIERADDRLVPRKYLNWETGNLEKKIFQKLEISNPRNGEIIASPINDLMQGIRISDSAPIAFENLTLVGKYDRKPDGMVNSLPIFRECLAPRTEANFDITFDMPILAKAGLDLTTIQTALHNFADEHYANYEQYFAELPEDADISAQQGVDIILGGGAGYASKTITYNLAGKRDEALPIVAKIMTKQFAKHQHSKDVSHHKVSPHTLKTTMYKGSYYQMGRCELIFQ